MYADAKERAHMRQQACAHMDQHIGKVTYAATSTGVQNVHAHAPQYGARKGKSLVMPAWR